MFAAMIVGDAMLRILDVSFSLLTPVCIYFNIVSQQSNTQPTASRCVHRACIVRASSCGVFCACWLLV